MARKSRLSACKMNSLCSGSSISLSANLSFFTKIMRLESDEFSTWPKKNQQKRAGFDRERGIRSTGLCVWVKMSLPASLRNTGALSRSYSCGTFDTSGINKQVILGKYLFSDSRRIGYAVWWLPTIVFPVLFPEGRCRSSSLPAYLPEARTPSIRGSDIFSWLCFTSGIDKYMRHKKQGVIHLQKLCLL